ncbi:MAG TPA: glycosyltransferase family 2 protein [Candidatus Paceibacterota bacterium]|jgi:dolichol-phosphate mannosyltransferase|nr:glycosyltransferase family 2 protein [Candidatus Paceibacterota bacterium]
MKLLTVVAPVYNEAEGIRTFYTALAAELKRLSAYEWRILLVNDGSTDGTRQKLAELTKEDSHVQVLHFSRNFGHQAALLAGIDHAQGDVVITMDSDLQHPPALIGALVAEYEKGHDIVYTVRQEADELGFLRLAAGALFYRTLNLLSDVPIARNASDFRLVSRRVADLLRDRMRERTMFMRGLISWMGFSHAYVPFKAGNRFAGRSKFSLSKNMRFAVFGLISFSRKPLQAAAFLGGLFALLGFIFALVTVVQYFFGSATLVPGWATVIVLISVLGGVQLMFLGIIGEYIGAIFEEVKARPHYIVADAVGFTPPERV